MPWFPKHTVVVPIDFSELAFAALKEARGLVPAPSSLHAVHVLPVLHPHEPGMIWGTVSDEEREKHVRVALAEALGDDFGGIHVHVRFGPPGQTIVRLAEELKAELICMPSHGRTGLARLGLGSVAEKVIRLAHCPVLVLRS